MTDAGVPTCVGAHASVSASNEPACVVDSIARWSYDRPRVTAVADRQRRLSYAGLMNGAHRLAHQLIAKSVRPGDVVGLLMEPSCHLAVALLAVWRAGAVSLPMDPAFPAVRLQGMLENAGCRWVVSLSAQSEWLRSVGVVGIYPDANAPWIARQPATAPEVAQQALACLLYTSGSTGQPKGVALSHRALLNKILQPGAWGPLDPGCRAAWQGSPAFDASLAQLLLPLTHGGFVRAFDRDERLDPRRLWAAMVRHRITVLDATPSWLMAMLAKVPQRLSLQRVVMGGEILTPTFAQRVQACFPQACLVNVYGPTEACIDATAHRVTAADLASDTIPIGQALPGYRLRLLDDALQAVADGEVGELCIGGIGLAEGYWRQPQATAERFIRDPQAPGERLYRTGDLARRRPDGALEFLGRRDQQVKVRGQRIELGEIEAVLGRLEGVAAGVVRTWPAPGSGVPVLVAHVVLNGATVAQVRDHLRRELPAFMLPAAVACHAELPLLSTGKVDRARLSPPHWPHEVSQGTPGRDQLERELLVLWKDVLQIECGPHDNFFEVGGDSLSAVDVLLGISRQFGIEMPLATLLAHPTVADLALVLARGDCTSGEGGRVVRLGGGASHGQQAPLFLLPPGSGAGLVYAGLARELAHQVPCCALQAVSVPGAAVGRHAMADLAACFADDIERLQPRGELRLCGYSTGGAVAHALAGQLTQRGRRISHLVLLDPYAFEEQAPLDAAAPLDALGRWRCHASDLLWDAFGLRGAAAEPLLRATERLMALGLVRADAQAQAGDAAARRALAQVRRVLPSATSLEVFLLLLEGATNLGAAYAGYAPQPLARWDGRAWLVQPEGDPPALQAARLARWQAWVGAPLQVHRVPGTHSTLLQRAHSVAGIGELLRTLFTAHRAAA